MVSTSATRRLSPADWLNNLTHYRGLPLRGRADGLRALIRQCASHPHHHTDAERHLRPDRLGVFIVSPMYSTSSWSPWTSVIVEGRSLQRQVREVFIPLLPGRVATGALADDPGRRLYKRRPSSPVRLDPAAVDLPVPGGRAAALRGPRRPTGGALDPARLAAARRAHDAGETLALRDRMTARHAAAVARYARELARRGRLRRGRTGHRSIPPDCCTTSASSRCPTASSTPRSSSDQDWAVIRRHPQDGRNARRPARRLRPGRRRDPLPPRARRRQRLSGRPDRQARSRWRRGSSRSAPPTTR